MKDNNPTTMMYSRTARPTKVEYAEWCDIPKEKMRLSDKLIIVLALCIYAGIIYVFVKY